uniref:Uncharacterized protein n=1 Tax=Anopheles farauti TaxID=69004 RepID=A0A182Q027_9DIPT
MQRADSAQDTPHADRTAAKDSANELLSSLNPQRERAEKEVIQERAAPVLVSGAGVYPFGGMITMPPEARWTAQMCAKNCDHKLLRFTTLSAAVVVIVVRRWLQESGGSEMKHRFMSELFLNQNTIT